MSGTSEAELIAEAQAILGTNEEVLGAGYFGLSNLFVASVVGGTAGGLVGSEVGADATGFAAAAGSRLAIEASAAGQGVTVQLIVAVTADTIHVLNRDTGGRLATEVISFARDAVDIHVSRLGLSRILKLTDQASHDSIELHGTVLWISPLAQGDKIIFDLLHV